MTFWYGNHIGAWGWVVMTIGMVAFWGLLITGIVSLVRHLGGGTPRAERLSVRATPEQLIAEQFAHGEIDETEYTGRLAALHGRHNHDGPVHQG